MSNKKRKYEYNNDLKLNEKIQKVLQESNLIHKLEKECECYFNVDLEKYIIEIILESNEGSKNLCVECGCDIGLNNPRQLCGKTFCFGIE